VIRDPVVAEDVAEVPEALNDFLGVHGSVRITRSGGTGRRVPIVGTATASIGEATAAIDFERTCDPEPTQRFTHSASNGAACGGIV
jgi:hypothetical protein